MTSFSATWICLCTVLFFFSPILILQSILIRNSLYVWHVAQTLSATPDKQRFNHDLFCTFIVILGLFPCPQGIIIRSNIYSHIAFVIDTHVSVFFDLIMQKKRTDNIGLSWVGKCKHSGELVILIPSLQCFPIFHKQYIHPELKGSLELQPGSSVLLPTHLWYNMRRIRQL